MFAPAQDGQVIRFGLAAVKGVGEVAVQNILKARAEGGRFKSLSDLCERVDSRTLNRKVLEALIRCGACDCLGENRASLFGAIERTLARAATVVQDRQRGQHSLFGMFEETHNGEGEKIARVPEWPQQELLAGEKELLGFYVTGHPLTPYLPLLERYNLATSASAAKLPTRTVTRIGGLVSALQQGISKKSNKPYAMVTLEDLEGTLSMLCINENYDRYRELLVLNKPLMVVGEINNAEDKPKIFPQEIMPLDDAPRRFTKQVILRLHSSRLTAELLDSVHQLVQTFSGKCPLFLCLIQPGGEKVFLETHEKFYVTPGRELQSAVNELFGEDTYYAKADTSVPERPKRAWENGG